MIRQYHLHAAALTAAIIAGLEAAQPFIDQGTTAELALLALAAGITAGVQMYRASGDDS